jgi:HSP20 family protein
MQVRIAASNRQPEASHGSFPVSPFRLFEDFYREWASRVNHMQGEWKPPVDILEKDGNLILRAELPGIVEKDIDIKLEGMVLTIKGERRSDFESDGYSVYQAEGYYGPFSRSFTLPETVDPEKISANFKNGVLSISLPQRPEIKPRSIKVNGEVHNHS